MSNDTVEIKLTKGYTTIIDSCDVDLLDKKWTPVKDRNTYYAQRHIKVNGKRTTEKIHRTILARIIDRELMPYEKVDHIDGNGLNNVRSNLRLANNGQNAINSRMRVNNTSGYKGVSKTPRGTKWRARITNNGALKYLGVFDTPEEAYAAYCEAAIKYHGEFARLK